MKRHFPKLVALCFALVVVWGCQEVTHKDKHSHQLDSALEVVALRIDSLSKSIATAAIQQDSLQMELSALHDSASALIQEAHWHHFLGPLPANCDVFVFPSVKDRHRRVKKLDRQDTQKRYPIIHIGDKDFDPNRYLGADATEAQRTYARKMIAQDSLKRVRRMNPKPDSLSPKQN
jgi:hypothetical protein